MRNGHNKTGSDVAPMALLGVSVLLGITIVVEIASFFAASAGASNLLARATMAGKPADNEMDRHLADAKSAADKLKKSNLFIPAPPKENPVKEVIGILGDEALINGKWCKVGDSIGDAKVVTVEPTQVRVAWNGQESTFAPITAAGSSSGGPAGGPAGRPTGGPRGGPDMVAVGSPGSGGGPRAEGGFQMPSADERTRMREQFANMSEEERQAFRERMQAQFGGRGGPGRRGGDEGSGRRGGGN